MYIGIDVGGTFTDGVIVENGQVKHAVKVPTQEDLTKSMGQVLDQLVTAVDPVRIQRIVLSSTLITNLLAQKKQKPVGLLLLPGPGVNPAKAKFAIKKIILKGAVDYKGRIIEDIDLTEVKSAVETLLGEGIEQIAVACKFSQRNPVLEERIIKYIKDNYPHIKTLASHQVNGLLNWVRRANGTAFDMMVSGEYRSFIEQIKLSLAVNDIACPIHILKADGGTMPLEISLEQPLEAIFSGPAASTLGALAAAGNNVTCVVMDIGGTTTDLALILNGVPLISERGASVNGIPVPSRALAVSSLALGGDTPLLNREGNLELGERQGPAFCLGGPCLTVTDVLVFCGLSDIGSREQVQAELVNLGRQLYRGPDELAEEVLMTFLNALEVKLEEMFKTWEEEPAYRVWQVVSQQKTRPDTLVCLGGPAHGLGAFWGRKKKWKVIIPKHAGVANAVGAALAKPTLRLDLLADTEQVSYSTNIGLMRGKLDENIKNVDQARNFAVSLFTKTLEEWQVRDNSYIVLYEEGFNIVRGWHTAGKIFQVGLQTSPGLEYYLDPAQTPFLSGGEENA